MVNIIIYVFLTVIIFSNLLSTMAQIGPIFPKLFLFLEFDSPIRINYYCPVQVKIRDAE